MSEKVRTGAYIVVLILGGGALFYLFFKVFASVLFPFVFGWGIAMLVRPPAAWLHKRLRLPLGVARLLLVMLAAALLGALLFFGIRGLIAELSALIGRFGTDSSTLTVRIREWLATIPIVGERLASGSFLGESLSMIFSALPEVVGAIADVLPSFFFALGVGALAAVYFCLDLDRIHAALARLLPGTAEKVFRFVGNSALRAAFSVLRAQGILMLLAFTLMLAGFILLNVKFPLLLSAIFALLDFLPVIGVGAFLVPWGVWSLLTGERALGIGLLILFGVISVIRQFAEPRLLSSGYGVHPLITLLSLYAGARLFGFMGMLIFPAITLLLYEMLFPAKPAKKRKLSIQNKKSP